MGQSTAFSDQLIIKRHQKGNASLKRELIKLSVDQYKRDENIELLRSELQKIATLSSRSHAHHTGVHQ
ncbi:MAG: hypothetical protein HQL69_18330 [Magnetococcales bacterium]|nr:hypothetical protein [Magnetococcales bacterium]